jgi:glycosyltransferase involved in cell wall biosynthesis
MRVLVNAIALRQGGGVIFMNKFIENVSKNSDLKIDIYGFDFCSVLVPDNVRLIAPPVSGKNYLSRMLIEKFYFPFLLLKYNYDVFFCPSNYLSGWVPARTKSVAMFVNMLPFCDETVSLYSGFAFLKFKLLKHFIKKSYVKADFVVFISNYARERLSKLVSGLSEKSVVIPHGSNDLFLVNSELERYGPLLYVSIFDEYKHQVELVEGLSLYKKKNGSAPKLNLIGFSGGCLERVKGKIKDLSMENEVYILGALTHDEMHEYYERARIIVFASSCENCPNVLLEAMSSKRPVLSSNIMPMPEFLGEDGLYFDPKNPASFCEALEAYYDNDERLTKSAEDAYERSKDYSWEVNIGALLSYFESVSSGLPK